MAETRPVPPQTTPGREGSSPTTPGQRQDHDQQALAILDRAAIEMADRTPPGPTTDAGASIDSPSKANEPPIGTQSLAQHNLAAGAVPAEIMKLAEQMKPAQDRELDIKPVETSNPIEEIKPAEQFQLVEQFDPMTIVSPPAPAPPKAETKIGTKTTPPAFRPMFDDHFHIALTSVQSLVLAIAIVALVIGAFGMAAYGWAAAHDWSCRLGLVTNYCPSSNLPKPLAQPEIPT